MARVTVPYEDAIAMATSGMTYIALRQAWLEAGVDVRRSLDRARQNGDLQLYNFRLEDGSLETRVALRGEAIPQGDQ